MSVVCDKIQPGIARLADQRPHIQRRRALHPVGVRNELHTGVDALVEPKLLKLRTQAREPFCLLCLCTEFIQIEKLAERFVAGEPDFLVEDIRIDWCRRELQIDTRIFTERCIVDQLA